MANQIQATIYQIDGNPQAAAITVNFLTSELVIKATTISTIPAVNSAIYYYNVVNNQQSVQTYYAGETIATLVALANNGETSHTQATVLEINGDPQVPGGIQYSFPSASILIGQSINPATGVNAFVQYKGTKYYTAETQATLYNNSNAGGGGGIIVVGSGLNSSVRCGNTNTASGLYSTVFGKSNTAQAVAGSIGGGICNNVCNVTSGCLALGAVVAGGVGNNTTGGTWDLATCSFTVAPTICNAGRYSFIGGGFQNRAGGSNNAQVVSGGCLNVSSHNMTTISGGYKNTSSFWTTVVGGGYMNTSSGDTATVGGGQCNTASGGYSTIAGGKINLASAACSTISGGLQNCTTGTWSSIGGGRSNVASASYSNVSGGFGNTASALYASVLSGRSNISSSAFSTIGGGCKNLTQAIAGFIGGGICNNVCNATACFAFGAVVVGGVGNNTSGGTWNETTCSFTVSPTICSTGRYSFIGGGFQNRATDQAVVSGGCLNISSGVSSVTGGGKNNTTSGTYGGTVSGYLNTTSGNWAFTGGGRNNTTSGACAFTGGGRLNTTSGALGFTGGGCNNITSGIASGILGGCLNTTNANDCAFIVGSNITADRACATFVNNLSIKDIPTSSVGLPAGSVWSNAGILTIV